MAFGRRNNKGAGAEAPAEAENVQRTSGSSKPTTQKKRKPNELLSSVVNESAVGAAIDLLKQNPRFALPNGTAWVGLLLSAQDIGGLSQKQKGDATKGSIIELISADKIQVVATADMLKEEYLGIIPSEETLNRMDEYSLLTQAPYYWAVFRSTSNGEGLVADAIQGIPASFGKAVEVARGDIAISTVLPEVWIWGGGEAEPVLTAGAPLESELALVGAAAGSGSKGAPALDNDPLSEAFVFDGDDGVDYSALATDDEPQFDVSAFESQFDQTPEFADEPLVAEPAVAWVDDDEPDFDPEDEADVDAEATVDAATEGYYQYVEENRDRVVDEQEVRDTIARRFLSNDLDLVVDMAEFDRVFQTEAPAISLQIAEDSTDWLGSQVAQLSRQANAELEQLNRGNAAELRELFVETMALHVEKTMAIVSPETPGSQYYNLIEGAKKDFEARRALAPQEVSAQRREITERFEQAGISRADQAAAHARAVYEDKNRPKLERDLADVGLDLDRRLEEQHAHDRQTVLEMRRKDANVRMDVGANRIFELLRERQSDQRSGERELLEHWNGELTRFIDENRKNDVSRAIALAEQLSRDNTVEDMKAEHATRLEEIRTEHHNREGRLNAELARIREEAITQLTARQTEWTMSLNLEKDRSSSNGDLVTQLTAQLGTLGAKYEEQYQGTIKALEADKKSHIEDLERTNVIHKRTNNLLVVLVVVLTIAALAVGIIAGWAWGFAAHPAPTESAPAAFAVVGSWLPVPTAWFGS